MSKIKNVLINCGKNLLLYIGILFYIIFLGGLGYRGKYRLADEANWYVALIGFIGLLPFFVYFYISNKRINSKNKKDLEEQKLLVINGIKTDFDLTILDIIQQENFLKMGNELVINKYGNKNHKIILKSKKNKFSYGFLTDINKDNLKIYFALNPITSLYTDKNDKYKKYLDLDFLLK